MLVHIVVGSLVWPFLSQRSPDHNRRLLSSSLWQLPEQWASRWLVRRGWRQYWSGCLYLWRGETRVGGINHFNCVKLHMYNFVSCERLVSIWTHTCTYTQNLHSFQHRSNKTAKVLYNIKGAQSSAGQRSQTPYSCFNTLEVSTCNWLNTYMYSWKYINRNAVETDVLSTWLQPTCDRTAHMMHHQLQVRGLHITPDSTD